ncbi:MAG: lysylphosphatidylglycerol synthase transmembrane domain-containing protein [Candidatus Saccharimonadales bacterium]
MTFRFWISLVTFILLAIVVILGWGEIVRAWNLLGSVNIWVWLLLIPVQLFSYYATGEMIFSYLRSKGDLMTTSRWHMTRTALELNFVNHIFPSGGAAGFSYLGWVLHRNGVSAGRSTMAQIIRFVLTFVSFVMIVIISVITLAFDHKIDKTILTVSSLLIFLAVGGVTAIIYAVSNHKRLVRFSSWLTRVVNKVVSKLTRGKKKNTLDLISVEKFFTDLHQDYLEIKNDNNILIRPFIWAVIANILDVVLISVAFLSLGFWVSPAILFIAFGISSIVSVFSATPGGAGIYEAIMIAFLASAGVPPEVAIAGTLLARTTLLIGTVIFGYIFYQLTINKYGKATK